MWGTAMHRVCALVTLACLLGLSTAARAEDLPGFVTAHGQPAIAFGAGDSDRAPIATDRDHTYVGGVGQIDVFAPEGDWLTFWPFSSAVRGLGAPDHSWRTGYSPVSDLATSEWGTVYALDATYAAVHRYASDGSFLGGWGGRGDGPGQFGSGDTPIALCAGSDAVYVVTIAGEAWNGGGRVWKFTPEGQFQRVWDVPAADLPDVRAPLDIAPTPDGGVWLLTSVYGTSGDIGYIAETRVYRYSSEGVATANWTVANAGHRIGAEDVEWGQVWVLQNHGTQYLMRSYEADGTQEVEYYLDAPSVDDFAVRLHGGDGAAWQVALLAREAIPGPAEGVRDTMVRRIDVYSRNGVWASVAGDYYDLLARGALIGPPTFAVTPAGEVSVKTDALRADLSYVTHFGADGEVAEVLRIDDWPIYSPARGEVEFVSQHYAGADAEGNYYTTAAASASTPEGDLQWTLTLNKYSPSEEPLATYELLGPVTPSSAAALLSDGSQPALALGQDGNLRVALAVGNQSPDNGEVFGRLWVGTVTTGGELLSAWTDASLGPYRVNGLAIDPANSLYVVGEGAWKYSSDGRRVGRIGGWGGTGDQGEAPGSRVSCAAAVDIDATGHLRVLDSLVNYRYNLTLPAADHLLLFAYTQSSFADVPYYHWAKEAIESISQAGLASGYPDGRYHPEGAVTRDQMAVYLSRALAGGEANVPAGPATATFVDVPVDYWAYRCVEYAVDRGLVSGYARGVYRPTEEVDRGQMAVFIARATATPTAGADLADYTPPATASFPDVPTGFWAYKYVEYIKAGGVTGGYPDGRYHPEHVCTRDQMAVYLQRAFALAP
jgi:hypothetical protein